jgi:hypothetical protein
MGLVPTRYYHKGYSARSLPLNDVKDKPGYWIAAYRNLTPSMLQDLKTDTATFTALHSLGSKFSCKPHL